MTANSQNRAHSRVSTFYFCISTSFFGLARWSDASHDSDWRSKCLEPSGKQVSNVTDRRWEAAVVTRWKEMLWNRFQVGWKLLTWMTQTHCCLRNASLARQYFRARGR